MSVGNFVVASQRTISEAISKLTFTCEQCDESMTYFCLQACCSDEPIFCQACQRNYHIGHCTNDLAMLFINTASTIAPDVHMKTTLVNVMNALQKGTVLYQGIMEQCSETIELYKSKMAEVEILLENAQKHMWSKELFNIVENYITGKEKKKTGKESFRTALKTINLDHKEATVNLNTILASIQKWEKTNSDITKEMEVLKASSKKALPENHLFEVLKNWSHRTFVSLKADKKFSSKYRPAYCSVAPETFEGERLLLTIGEKLPTFRPHLKEIRSQQLLQFPFTMKQAIQQVVVRVNTSRDTPYQFKAFLNRCNSVSKLSIEFFKTTTNSYHSANQLQSIMQCFNDVNNLQRLKVLLVCSPKDLIFTNKQAKILIKLGVKFGMRYLGIFEVGEKFDWKKFADDRTADTRLNILNRMYKRRIYQSILLAKSRLKHFPCICRQYLLSLVAASFEEKGSLVLANLSPFQRPSNKWDELVRWQR